MQGNGIQDIFVFEDVKAPRLGGWWKSGFRWFIVFEDDVSVGYCICFSGEETRWGIIRFLLVGFGIRFYDCVIRRVGGFGECGLLGRKGGIRSF